MQSRTSFFNRAVFRKNLTRFAPVWGGYLLCLILGMVLLYTDGGTAGEPRTRFRFVMYLADVSHITGLLNLCYAFLVGQLLFGDLYNSRMCNMIHALPIRREGWFLTNLASGLAFSLIPTAIVSLAALPLLADTLFVNAWQMAFWFFLSSNLQFVCFFGMAAFSAMCVGNRFTMSAGYGLLNAGAYLFYWLVDMVYTPMLYGVITPTTLATNLTPLVQMTQYTVLKTTSWSDMVDDRMELLPDAVGQITATGEWWRLFVCAGVGIAFALAALWLYRRRDLECAGDAVAFRVLTPVFQVLCALFVMVAAQGFLYFFAGLRERNFLILSVGLVVGWFVGKMLIERTTRVFRLKNWYGLFGLAAVLVLSLVLTHFDVLGIETRLPDADKVEKIYFNTEYNLTDTLTERSDIEAAIRLQELAVQEPVENSGTYVVMEDGSRVYYTDSNSGLIDEEQETGNFVYAARVNLNYLLKNGNLIRRQYYVWTEEGAGLIAKEIQNRWESVNNQYVNIDGQQVERLPLVLDSFKSIYLGHRDGDMPEVCFDKEKALELLEAIKADCEAGNMAQHPLYHSGHFIYYNEKYTEGYSRRTAIEVGIAGKEWNWSVAVYADSENTLRWLEEHGLLDMEVSSERIRMW